MAEKKEVEKKSILDSLTPEERKELIAQLIDEAKESMPAIKESERNTPIASTDIPDNDLMEKPSHFYMWTNVYIDLGYKFRGQSIEPPYGRPIKFTSMPPQISTTNQGKRQELRWCAAEIWSKKEDKYIRSTPYFKAGIIMENDGDLKYQDTRSMTLKMRIITELSAMNKNQLIEMCRGRNLQTSNDMNKMHEVLVASLVSEQDHKMNSFQKDILERSNKDLLKK